MCKQPHKLLKKASLYKLPHWILLIICELCFFSLSPDGKFLIFLSAKASVDSGAHSATGSLHRIDWPTDCKLCSSTKIIDVVSSMLAPCTLVGSLSFLYVLSMAILTCCNHMSTLVSTCLGSLMRLICFHSIKSLQIPIVNCAEDGHFPGLYCSSFLSKPWLSDGCTMILSSYWHSCQVILSVNVLRWLAIICLIRCIDFYIIASLPDDVIILLQWWSITYQPCWLRFFMECSYTRWGQCHCW